MTKSSYSKMRILLAIFMIGLVLSCNKKEQPLFTLHSGKDLGLNFNNELTLTPELNIFKYMYFYNGGGLASGDLNNDGLIDLIMTSNLGGTHIYLNKGNLQFEDITEKALINKDSAWSNGVSIVDINNDGYLDFYVSKVSGFLQFKGANSFYICKGLDSNGIPQYEDKAAEYGLNLEGFGTQAAFFDYDMDGDLDFFQLNHSVHANGTFGERIGFLNSYHETSGDRLFRNDNNTFKDVTKESGIHSSVIGYGLGIVVSDINMDGYPDIYIGNDFHENDYLYINQRNGTFKDSLVYQMNHTSRFSMGVDASDLDNNGYPEIISLDMLPEDPFILKKSEGEDAVGIFNFKLTYGYNHQYARNCLQYNNGNGTFSEIASFSRIHATDWSWSPLFFDMNGDGSKDLFISNGIPKRMNDIDYINFVSEPDWQWKTRHGDLSKEDMSIIHKIPEIKIKNKLYIQDKDLIFNDINTKIENDLDGYSNSAIYADLDLDGDLDVVTNNINDFPFIYENKSANNNKENALLSITIKDCPNNVNCIGSKVVVYYKGKKQYHQNFTVKGFQSSMINPIFFNNDPDSVAIILPDNTFFTLKGAELTKGNNIVKYKKSNLIYDYNSLKDSQFRLSATDISSNVGLNYIHRENPYIEFNREPLIPHSCGEEGPALAVGDINGDKLDDIFIGSSKTFYPVIYIQNSDFTFSKMRQPDFEQDSMYEEVAAVFEDIDNDGDLDLIVASGGNEFRIADIHNSVRLFLNDGKGLFSWKKESFGEARLTASNVVPYDFNNDKLIDFYIPARSQPWAYGEIPKSYLFMNEGNGKFKDVIKTVAPDLEYIGMVKDAKLADLNNDNIGELIVAVEWDKIYMFKQVNGLFKKMELTNHNGLWQHINTIDIDGDGDLDILAGNYGTNTRFNVSSDKPLHMYYSDFDDNGTKEQLITYYLGNKEVIFANKSELEKQVPFIKKKYIKAVDFAKASINDMFSTEKIKKARIFQVDLLHNCVLINDGNLNFKLEKLPNDCQWSPINTSYGIPNKKSVLIGGNFFNANVQLGRYDADFGSYLDINTKGKIERKDISGINIIGEVKQILPIKMGDKTRYIYAINNEPIKLLEFNLNN